MKIIIDRNTVESRQFPIITIDTQNCYYPYAIREALTTALEMDGYDSTTIRAVFNQDNEDLKTPTQE